MSFRSQLAFQVLLVVTLALVSFLSFAPLDAVSELASNDKLGHFLAFLFLAWLADFAFPQRDFGWLKILPLLLYGLLIELAQHQISYRQFSWLDWLADGAGLASYALVVPLLRKLPLLNIRWRPKTSL